MPECPRADHKFESGRGGQDIVPGVPGEGVMRKHTCCDEGA